MHWVYAKEIDLPNYISEDGRQSPFPTWLSLGKLWALAHYLDCIGFRDDIIDAMLRKMRDHPRIGISTDSLVAIFELTPENSTIQRLLTEYTAATISVKEFQGNGAQLPSKWMRHLAEAFVAGRARSYPEPSLQQRCQFHEHGKNQGCWDQRK